MFDQRTLYISTMGFTKLQYYVDTLRLLNSDDLSLNEKFQAFSDCFGEEKMLQLLKKFAFEQSKDTTSISSLHNALQRDSNCLNFKSTCNQSTFTGRGLCIKSILCHILSMLDIKSYSKCCSVNRQWFHDSFDCPFGNVLDLSTLQQLSEIDDSKSNCRSHKSKNGSRDRGNRDMIGKYMRCLTKCKSVRSKEHFSKDIYSKLIDNWDSFEHLESIDINLSSIKKSLVKQLLVKIANKCDNIKVLKLEYGNDNGDEMDYGYHLSYSSERYRNLSVDEINQCFEYVNGDGFSKLEILELKHILPLVLISHSVGGNTNINRNTVYYRAGFGVALKEVRLDIDMEHVGILKTFLEYYCESGKIDDIKLNVFELIVATRKKRVIKDGNIDGELFICHDLKRLSRFISNVSKLKIHCPYIRKFQLLAYMCQETQFHPNLNDLDIRLEFVDNIQYKRKQMKMTKERKKDSGIVKSNSNVNVGLDEEEEDDLGYSDSDVFEDIDLSKFEIENVKILIDKDWYSEFDGNIERMGEMLHNAKFLDIKQVGCYDFILNEYRNYDESTLEVSKACCFGSILGDILCSYVNEIQNTLICARRSSDSKEKESKQQSMHMLPKLECICAEGSDEETGDISNTIEVLKHFISIDKMRRGGSGSDNDDKLETRILPLPLCIDFEIHMNKKMKFSELRDDVPKLISNLQYLVENCLVNIKIQFDFSAPEDILDEYKGQLLKSLNEMDSSKLNQQLKYYVLLENGQRNMEFKDHVLVLRNAKKAQFFNHQTSV